MIRSSESRRGVYAARAMVLASGAALLLSTMGLIAYIVGFEGEAPATGFFMALGLLLSSGLLALSLWTLSIAEGLTARRGSELQMAALQATPDIILQLDDRLRIVAINPAAVRRFGHSAEALSGMPLSFLLPSPRASSAAQPSSAETPRPSAGEPPKHESKVLLGEGTQTSARRLGLRAGTRLSHLVQPLLGFTEIALDSLEPGHPVRADLEEIGRASARVAMLAQSLEMFGGVRGVQVSPLELNGFLLNLERDLRFVLQPSTVLRLKTTTAPLAVMADAGLTRIAVLLLACNAEEAMRPGSTIAISSRPGGLEIADTGTGLPKEVRVSLFRPLTSTKDAERGVGLGLHAARAAMRLQHGELLLTHSGESGSVLTLSLPTEGEAPDGPPEGVVVTDSAALSLTATP